MKLPTGLAKDDPSATQSPSFTPMNEESIVVATAIIRDHNRTRTSHFQAPRIIYRARFQVRPWYWVCGWLLLTVVDTVTVCKVDDRRAEI